MESLSTGLKSNLSREDPAAFLRGSQMAAHVRWQTEAVQNISNAGAMAGVADTGIEQVSDALLRIRELALQAANATTDKDRASLQSEVAQLVDSITRLALDTKYNGVALLGEYKDPFKFQVGVGETDFLSHSIDSFRPQDIGAHTYSSEGDGALTAAASVSDITRADNPSVMTVINDSGQATDINWRNLQD